MAPEKNQKELLSRLFLVGTVHRDPDGFQRSIGFLENLKPGLVLVELSPFGFSFRQEHQQHLTKTLWNNLALAAQSRGMPMKEALKHPEIKAIYRQISLPFEYRAATKYALSGNAKVVLVDDSIFSQNWIGTWPELLSTENLATLLFLPPGAKTAENLYSQAAFQVKSQTPTEADSWIEKHEWSDKLWQERERFMAEEIRKAVLEFAPPRALFLGGWWHLKPGYDRPTVRSILDVPPDRCFLLDQDPAM